MTGGTNRTDFTFIDPLNAGGDTPATITRNAQVIAKQSQRNTMPNLPEIDSEEGANADGQAI